MKSHTKPALRAMPASQVQISLPVQGVLRDVRHAFLGLCIEAGQKVLAGERYEGRAFVVDAWYLTAYEPLRDEAGNVDGMLFVTTAWSKVYAFDASVPTACGPATRSGCSTSTPWASTPASAPSTSATAPCPSENSAPSPGNNCAPPARLSIRNPQSSILVP